MKYRFYAVQGNSYVDDWTEDLPDDDKAVDVMASFRLTGRRAIMRAYRGDDSAPFARRGYRGDGVEIMA